MRARLIMTRLRLQRHLDAGAEATAAAATIRNRAEWARSLLSRGRRDGRRTQMAARRERACASPSGRAKLKRQEKLPSGSRGATSFVGEEAGTEEARFRGAASRSSLPLPGPTRQVTASPKDRYSTEKLCRAAPRRVDGSALQLRLFAPFVVLARHMPSRPGRRSLRQSYFLTSNPAQYTEAFPSGLPLSLPSLTWLPGCTLASLD